MMSSQTIIRRFQMVILGSSALLWAVVSWGAWRQPDSWAAILILPRWLWLITGVALACCGWNQRMRWWFAGVMALWLVFAVAFVEETASVVRLPVTPVASGVPVRVVSLNCDCGRTNAAAEVETFAPEIVLLQEIPWPRDVEKLCRQLYGAAGSFVCGKDTAILVRGTLEPREVPRPWNLHFAQARAHLENGGEVEIVSLRLRPYDIREDFWNADCRCEQAIVRGCHREALEWLTRQIAAIPADVPVIVGGDFNMQGRDRLLQCLNPRLTDAFTVAGQGLGNTLVNDFPFVRIDQVWTSAHFAAVRVVAHRTEHSDHRMVVADLISTRKP